jgi:hypothetical protein
LPAKPDVTICRAHSVIAVALSSSGTDDFESSQDICAIAAAANNVKIAAIADRDAGLTPQQHRWPQPAKR